MSSNYMLFRCVFSIINICFFALGFAVVVYSWLLHIKSADYGSLMGSPWFTAPVILIISAKFSMLLGIVGCLGAWCEKRALLFMYIIIMIVVFVGLLFGVVYIIAMNERTAISAHQRLLDNIRRYPVKENEFYKKMDSVQRRLDCCGIDDYRDWSQGDVWSDQSHVPDSCCIEEKVGCGKLTNGNETNGLIYTDGCFSMIQKEINRNLMIVGILAFVLVFVEGFCIVVALVLFYSIFDVYFTSPINHGMPIHRSTRSPRAKRLVLFVADGLRSDKFFQPLNNTPYLNSIIEKRTSLSGISHTRVPTESRPGHVAIISGFYEDVSAVSRGWKENPVEFDSVFNRSTYTFGFGSPDIVPMFKRGQSFEHFYVDCYHSNDEEFGNDRAHELDLWVEREFRKFLLNNTLGKELEKDQIVFFFHLLGIDTNGHSHKPWSDAYMKNIQIVDGIVQRLENLIENYYKHDEKTTYVFTSDHGMTDWGSHGAGDDTETLTPLLIWGSGIRSSRHTNVHIEQADLCPLMSYFLGIDYAINSAGRLPIDYLLPVDEDLLQAYLQNARQLLEQVHQQHDILKKRLLFFNPFDLQEEQFFERMKSGKGYMNLHAVKDDIKHFMHRVAEASHYYHTYRRFLLSVLILTGFLATLCTILYQLNPTQPTNSSIALTCKLIPILIFVLLLVEQSPWTHLLYPALVCVHTFLSADFAIGWIRQQGLEHVRSASFWLKTFLIGLFLQTYIVPFFHRWMMSIGVFLLFIDAIYRWQGSFLHDRYRRGYGILLIIILIFPFLPTVGTIKITLSWCTILSGILTFIFHYLYFQTESSSSLINYIQRVCLLLAIIDNYCVHSLSVRSPFIHILSWILLLTSCFLPFFSSIQHRLNRLICIFTSIMTIYILFSTQYEALFVLCLCLLMLTWILTSEQQQKINLRLFTCQSFLFILLAFFGTGNFASVNSFDPSAVYCFLTVFNPFLMAFVTIVKYILPILIVNCATAYVMKNADMIKTFRLYTLILCDILALELFFFIRTEGSWLQIGESISRYVILMAMIVILTAFQFLASLLLNQKWNYFNEKQSLK
ncbi:unnamed protein product [Adineta ricciae]|uniref:GPI ethanolamine phosphate transferase 1 n=1 Tax=Adineta ricciae TaxID=249248 RepID=A0A814HD42_ADIRI|nr:unnamed protein product [Adineta ricciae]